MTGLTRRVLGRRFLLPLLPLGIILLLVSQSHPPEFPAEHTLGGYPTARVLPSGEITHHELFGPDPFGSRPSWAHLPGLDSLWEIEQSSGESPSVTPGKLRMPPVDTEPVLIDNDDRTTTVRIDYPDGSRYESVARQAFTDAIREWIGIEFVSSEQPGVTQFVTDLEDAQHPLIVDLSDELLNYITEPSEVQEVVDDATTVYRSDFPEDFYTHKVEIDGEPVSFEVTATEFQLQHLYETVKSASYWPAQRNPLVAWFLRISPVVGAVLGVIGLLAFGASLLGVDQRSRQLAQQLMASFAGQVLVERWLRRSRYFRFIGAAVFALLYIGRNRSSNVVIEAGALMFWMFVGVAVGGAVAELHLIRRRSDQAPLADLQPRSIRDYTTVRDRVAMAVVAIVSALLVVLRLTGVLSGSLLWSCLPLALVLVAYGFQYVVADRRRPAVPGVLRNADNVLRFLASTRGFGRPATSAACIALAQAVLWDSAPDWFRWAPLVLILTGIVWYASGSERRLPKLAQVRSTQAGSTQARPPL